MKEPEEGLFSVRVWSVRALCHPSHPSLTRSSSMPALQTGQARQWVWTCIHLRERDDETDT
jgi:hypothetical protein